MSTDSSYSTSSVLTIIMPGITFPPFPDDVPTHPLLVVDYSLIKEGNQQEIDKLWKAATELGFW
jgi:Trm5-related predicted tRNA methylase